jgi:putative toxin-antitoxin system antitoxin component (TIGR02293 family)
MRTTLSLDDDSMNESNPNVLFGAGRRSLASASHFSEFKSSFDTMVLELFRSKPIKKLLRDRAKLSLELLWERTARALIDMDIARKQVSVGQLEIHRRIVKGLPGEALFISSSMLFDSMHEALPFFDVSSKTARTRIGEQLTANEGEIALRIGRVLAMAGEVFGSLDQARTYLRTANFALGGAVPRDLLKTAEGEQLVLSELQAQAEGGPV